MICGFDCFCLIIFGWSITLSDLFSLKVIGIGFCILFIIYLIRALFLFLFQGKDIFPQLFLAPRGLITILLFFAIPEETRSANEEIEGVLLFIILTTCLIMSWALVVQKNKEKLQKEIISQVKDKNLEKESVVIEKPLSQEERKIDSEE